jgi:hypothetical protein
VVRVSALLGALFSALLVVVTTQTSGATAAERTVENSTAAPNATTAVVMPTIQITANSHPDPGLLFANPVPAFGTSPPWTGGPMIYDNAGHIVWYKPLANVHVMEPVTYKGQTALAYHLADHGFGGWTTGSWIILNQSYQQIGQIGQGVDHHELLMAKGGMAYVDTYHTMNMDLSKYGGQSNATVAEAVIQEIDLNTNKVVWEWHSFPHVPVTETYASLKDSVVDYFHINSIAVDTDGNLIVSGRHISAVLKINRTTGAVMWKLGGKNSTFHFTNDGGPSYQHDARVVGRNTYSIFDNGVTRSPNYSRGVTYKLDLTKHTATAMGILRHKPDLYSNIEGSSRSLPNGHRLIGWATTGVATEYSGKTVVFESKILSASSYRTFRSAWHGTPQSPPSLGVRRNGTAVTASASWNGATDVVGWQVLAGPDAQHLKVVRTVPYTGFQMTQTVAAATSDHVFAVRAVRSGAPVAQSGVASLP